MINRNNNKYKKVLYSFSVLIVLFIILSILSKALWGAYKKERLSNDNLLRQKEELQTLIAREESLNKSVEYLKTDRGIEAEIRSKFRVARDGEYLAVIVDDEVSTTSTLNNLNIASPQIEIKKGIFDRLLSWFGL